jgi:hypothetical protein
VCVCVCVGGCVTSLNWCLCVTSLNVCVCVWLLVPVTFAMVERILPHLDKRQLVKHLGKKSVSYIPSPNLAPIPSIDSYITGSDILAK